jgi:small GTP-binding protein
MNVSPIDFMVKTIMIGDQSVGKTTLSKKMTNVEITYNESATIGIDFFTTQTIINNHNIKLQIWDTAGNERFLNLIKLYYKNNAICYVVYDVSNELSFTHTTVWLDEFKNTTNNPYTVIVIVANKIDNISKRVISYEQGKKLAENYDAFYFEVSSKASVGIEKLVSEPLERVMKQYKDNLIVATDFFGLKNAKDENKKLLQYQKKTCCIIL